MVEHIKITLKCHLRRSARILKQKNSTCLLWGFILFQQLSWSRYIFGLGHDYGNYAVLFFYDV